MNSENFCFFHFHHRTVTTFFPSVFNSSSSSPPALSFEASQFRWPHDPLCLVLSPPTIHSKCNFPIKVALLMRISSLVNGWIKFYTLLHVKENLYQGNLVSFLFRSLPYLFDPLDQDWEAWRRVTEILWDV